MRSIGPCLVWLCCVLHAQPLDDFSLRLTAARRFREGELIRVELRFPVRIWTVTRNPPPQAWQFAGFLLHPAGECGSLASPCFCSGNPFDKSDPAMRAGLMNPLLLSLNNYLPRLRPGRYRVAAVARRMVLADRPPMSSHYRAADPPRYAVSNAVEFEVGPASAAWVDRAIDASVAILKSIPQPNTRGEYETRRAAAEQLRFLDRPRAWRVSLALLPLEEIVLLGGLAVTRQPGRVCELMQSALPAPDQAVSSWYLNVTTQVCARARVGPEPRYRPPELTAAQKKYWQERRAYEQSMLAQATARLAASLPGKQGANKGFAFQTLLEGVQQRQPNGSASLPAWVPSVRGEFLKSYATLEPWRQRHLLSMFAGALPSPDLVPLLESTLEGWKPGDHYEPPRQAIRILYALDHKRAQARILTELRNPRTWLDTPELQLLPPGDGGLTDDELIQALADAQRPGGGGWNTPLRMAALAKYASPRARSRVRAIFESQQEPCQPELVAYFVRADPEYAGRVFHRHPWDMQAAPPGCTLEYFLRTPPVTMGPALESYLAAYLMHRDVLVKKTAAQSLARFGSPAALPALWDAFRYFHHYWRGKAVALAENGEGVFLEVELRNAIARGRNWLAGEVDLRMIESLCISDLCMQETRRDLRAWQAPLQIELRHQPDGIRGTVAQYYDLDGMEAIEAKLAQFPRGTRFLLTARGPGVSDAAVAVRSLAAARGLIVAAR